MGSAKARRRQELAALVSEAKAALSPSRADPHAYAGRPVEYAKRVLGIWTLTPEQKQMLRALHEPPYRCWSPVPTT
jgi:hypothetical protein